MDDEVIRSKPREIVRTPRDGERDREIRTGSRQQAAGRASRGSERYMGKRERPIKNGRIVCAFVDKKVRYEGG